MLLGDLGWRCRLRLPSPGVSLGPLAADERELDPRLTVPILHDWKPDNLVELTSEAAALHALEEKLADVRRISSTPRGPPAPSSPT